MRIWAKKALTPIGWRENQIVEIENGVICSVTYGNTGDVCVPALAPGFVDLHHHGGNGYDSFDASVEDLERYLLLLARQGVTAFLLTGSCNDPAKIRDLAERVHIVMARQAEGKAGGTRLMGLHMEGPFLSDKRPGAMHVDRMFAPTLENLHTILGAHEDVLRLMTIAPELEGATELAAYLRSRGVCVQAGHTDASFEEAEEGFAYGFESLCHTFNAARGIHHREPGVLVSAFLQDEIYCEAICDLVHLHPGTIRLIHRLKGPRRMLIISDSVATNGLPDGEHLSVGSRVIVKNGVARTPSGALDGGTCHLDKSVRNLLSIGIPAEDAFCMASRTPALRMGWLDMGLLAPGMRADVVAMNENYEPLFSLVGGVQYNKED